MMNSIRHAADLARQTGAPLQRVFVNFLHGEADRSSAREPYRDGLAELVDRVDALAVDLGLPIDWLILDPAGTGRGGSGNNWPCRLAMADLAAERENVHLIGAGYAYPLDDVIHYSSEARALFGEHFGAAAAHLLARDEGRDDGMGWLLQAPRLGRAIIDGAEIQLTLESPHEFELHPDMHDPYLNVDGFCTTISARCHITRVEQTGPQSVTVTLNQPPAPHDRAELSYAYQLVRSTDVISNSPMPAGRGGWRSVQALDSMVLPGQRIHQWVPGFTIAFSQMDAA